MKRLLHRIRPAAAAGNFHGLQAAVRNHQTDASFLTGNRQIFRFWENRVHQLLHSLRIQLPPDVMDREAAAYFLQMRQELLRFWHMHEKMVCNIENSSMFPLLLSILLEQITGDVSTVLRLSCPAPEQNEDNLKGVAAFYAGGLISAFLRCTRQDSSIDESVFLEMAAQFGGKIPF